MMHVFCNAGCDDGKFRVERSVRAHCAILSATVPGHLGDFLLCVESSCGPHDALKIGHSLGERREAPGARASRPLRPSTSSKIGYNRLNFFLFLRTYQQFEVYDDEDFRISTSKYYYSIWTKPNELLIDFHYHPRQADLYKGHLHIPNNTGGAPVHFLINKHIPTARVPIEDIVRFMIQEVNIEPRQSDWQDVLSQSEQNFSNKRTK